MFDTVLNRPHNYDKNKRRNPNVIPPGAENHH